MPAATAIYSLIESAELNGLNSRHYLADALPVWPITRRRIAETLAPELVTGRHCPRSRLSSSSA
jgi:hypothetical protein